jgi:hypothetical protein
VIDLQAAGMTKENNAELGKLSIVLDLYARAKQLKWVSLAFPQALTDLIAAINGCLKVLLDPL